MLAFSGNKVEMFLSRVEIKWRCFGSVFKKTLQFLYMEWRFVGWGGDCLAASNKYVSGAAAMTAGLEETL